MVAISVSNVSKSFADFQALRNVSFSIEPGERVTILGPNGAGKTTIMKLLIGLLSPDSGEILIDGHEPTSIEARSVVGYLPEDAQPYRVLTVRENLEYIAALRGVENVKDRADLIIGYLNLSEIAKTKISALSRGNVQRVSIGIAMMHSPKILLMDEPLNYLDIPTQENVIRLLDSFHATYFVSTHILSIAQRMTQRVIMISRGAITWQGTIGELNRLSTGGETLESTVSRMMQDEWQSH
ncbi:MAG: multidrug ABC transporter ATP-binding protein [Thermoplasmatales archaeon B_DKE]|nr:MAG: multidrug ABC transporter ATP-binding protein [Thermoplasmatales archaeon B_DKE]